MHASTGREDSIGVLLVPILHHEDWGWFPSNIGKMRDTGRSLGLAERQQWPYCVEKVAYFLNDIVIVPPSQIDLQAPIVV